MHDTLGWGREEQEEDSCGDDNYFLPRRASSVTVTKLQHFIIIPPFQRVDTLPELHSPNCTPQHFTSVSEAYLCSPTASSNEPKKKKKKKIPAHLPDLEEKEAYRKDLCMLVKEKIKGECSGNIKRSYKHKVLLMVVYEAELTSSLVQGQGLGGQ